MSKTAKTIWLMGDPDTNEDLRDLLVQEGYDARVIALSDSIDMARKANTCDASIGALPDLIITSWADGPGIEVRGELKASGEVIVGEMQQLGLDIPVTIFTGDPRIGYKKFPGLDVQVLAKPSSVDEIFAHIALRVNPSLAVRGAHG